MSRRIALAIALVPALSSFSIAADLPAAPPLPDFRDPIDYRAWYAKRVVCHGEENARAVLIPDDFNPRWATRFLTKDLSQKSEALIDNALRGGIIWQDDDHIELVQRLAKWEPQIANLKRAASLNCMWPPDADKQGHLFDLKLGGVLTTGREITKALIVSAWKAQPNQGRAILDATECVIKFARLLEHEKMVLSNLAAANTHREFAFHHLLAIAEADLLELRDLDRAIVLLTDCELTTAPLAESVVTEWGKAYDVIQFLYPGKKLSRERYDMLIKVPEFEQLRFPQKKIDPQVECQRLDKLFRICLESLDQPLSHHQTTKLKDAIRRWQTAPESPDQFTMIHEFLPSLYSNVVRSEALRRGTLLTLHLRRYHRVNKKWPRSLEELDLPASSSARVDPFSGEPFAYRLDRSRPTLYSFAYDGINGGGKTHLGNWGRDGSDGDFVFLPYQQPFRFPAKGGEDGGEKNDGDS